MLKTSLFVLLERPQKPIRNKRRLSTNEKVQKKKSTLYEQGAKEEIKNI